MARKVILVITILVINIMKKVIFVTKCFAIIDLELVVNEQLMDD